MRRTNVYLDEAQTASIEESFGVLVGAHFFDRGPDQREAHLDRLRQS